MLSSQKKNRTDISTMKRDILYPYTLKKKGNVIKLEIMPETTRWLLNILYIAVIIMSAISIIGSTISLFFNHAYTPETGFIQFCIIISSALFICYLWKCKRIGLEIFLLYSDKLENIIENKPFKIEKHIFKFKQLEI